MKKISSNDLRKMYLEYYKENHHVVIPSAPVVPKDDPTSLFTTAGMQQLVPYFMGKEHNFGDKLVDIQRCIRTVDIDEV